MGTWLLGSSIPRQLRNYVYAKNYKGFEGNKIKSLELVSDEPKLRGEKLTTFRKIMRKTFWP